MQRTRLFPLRHSVGHSLPVEMIEELARSPECAGFPLSIEPVGGAQALISHAIFSQFLPSSFDFPGQTTPTPALEGLATLPVHPDLPFPDSAPLWMITMGGSPVSEDISRKLWIEFRVTLAGKDQPLIGGICYGGYPFLPYYVTPHGETSSNFGLPRELRVSWRMAGGTSGFIDDETGVTMQQPAAHSGVHFMPIGPVSTNELILRLSDFPRILLVHRGLTGDPRAVVERWGLFIPFFYVYEHREQTRWSPRVPAALIAAQQSPANLSGSYYPQADPQGPLRGLCPDQVRLTVGADPSYAVLSAASIFGPARAYGPSPGTEQEFFLSGTLKQGEQVRLFLEQTEEHERCIAGLRLMFAPGIHVTEFSVEVYESDPIEGVSPVALDADPAKDKYSRRLFVEEYRNVIFANNTGVFRFVRPSTCRFFVIVITCLKDEGQVALFKAELVQSSSIFVGARPARRQDIQALRFRVTGPDIGSDYARLAPNGFSMAVEHVSAGQPRRVLFEASSLLELIESGGAQVLRNQRHLETTLEVSDLQANTKGWRQSETGKDVIWGPGIDPDVVRSPEDTLYLLPIAFRSYGTNETRIHTQQIGFVGDDKPTQMLQDQVKTLNELIQQVAGASNTEYVTIPNLASNPLFGSSATASSFSWKGIDKDRINNIQGLYHLNVPPFSLATQFATNVITLLQSYPDPPPAPELMQEFFRDMFLRTILSGFSGSVSLGYIFGVSLSSGQLLPSASRVATSGDTGTIQLQGTEAGYQFSRYLNTSYDRTRHVRRLVRKEEQRRRGADVTWQGEYVDIVTGVIPIGIRLPASSSDVYRTTDEAIRVRFSAPPDSNLRVDVWFDVIEEAAKDDY